MKSTITWSSLTPYNNLSSIGLESKTPPHRAQATLSPEWLVMPFDMFNFSQSSANSLRSRCNMLGANKLHIHQLNISSFSVKILVKIFHYFSHFFSLKNLKLLQHFLACFKFFTLKMKKW
jgi:hypothetical protein